MNTHNNTRVSPHLNGIHFIIVAAEAFEGSRVAHTAHIDHHVSGAGSKGVVIAPIHVQGSSCISRKCARAFM